MKIRRRLFGLTVSCILFFSGCAPASPYPTGNAYHEGTDLDGNNQHKWAELSYSHYTSDNQYLYMWNWPSSDIPMEDKTLTIYDKDANTVDRLPIGKLIPNYSEVYVSPGEHVFIYAKDEGMYAFPKSEIGSGNITPVQILEIPDATA